MPSWYFEFLHDLFRLAKVMLSLQFGVVVDEVGQPDLHFRVKSPSSSFFLLEFFRVVPSGEIFRMNTFVFCLGSDYLRKAFIGPFQFLSNLSNQVLLELNRITFISNCPDSLLSPVFLLHLALLLLLVQLISLFQQLRVNSIVLLLASDDECCSLGKREKKADKMISYAIELCKCFCGMHVILLYR